MKENLIHLPLEPYKQRYTEHLATWEREKFSTKFEVESVAPQVQVPMNIITGQVLDATARPLWAMQQVAALIQRPRLGRVYCSDFYTPGLDALAYSRLKPRLSSFCWAQTFDRYDFTTAFISWMRPWEVMAFDLYENVFVASELLADLICTALPGAENKVHIVGLPFDSKHVASLWDKTAYMGVSLDCVYSSRWDIEKDPNFFLSLVEGMPDLKFGICTGASEVRGTDRVAIERLRVMRERGQGNLTVFEGLAKPSYYAILAKSKVQFNCAHQDWVSFTLLEALTYGCAPLYPNRRSFPEALNYVDENLYRPGDIGDASSKLQHLVNTGYCPQRDLVLNYHDGTLGRIAEVLV